MNLYTADGISYHCLPACARCKISGESPETMDECPDRRFDDQGLVCIPELCDAYTEDETTQGGLT